LIFSFQKWHEKKHLQDHVFKSFLELKKDSPSCENSSQIKSLKNPIGCNMNIIIYYNTQEEWRALE
jgi:hypothetical protein